jgi:hypothetical protein
MQPALHRKTTVLPGGKIELTDPELPCGEAVDVFVLLPEGSATTRQSAIEVLARSPGRRLFKNAEEVDTYLHEERDTWDR